MKKHLVVADGQSAVRSVCHKCLALSFGSSSPYSFACLQSTAKLLWTSDIANPAQSNNFVP